MLTTGTNRKGNRISRTTDRSLRVWLLVGFAAVFAVFAYGMANHRASATQEPDRNMPSLTGDAAVEFLKKDASYASLEEAFTSADDDSLFNAPMAQTKIMRGGRRDYFGSGVAITGNTVIVGARSASNGSGPGTAYVFVNGGFSQELTATNGAPGDQFGNTWLSPATQRSSAHTEMEVQRMFL